MRLFIFLCLALSSINVYGQKPTNELLWKGVDDGLYLTEYLSPVKSVMGDSKITILKIDPSKYEFSLFSAKENGESLRTAKEWGEHKKQIAVINAGMHLSDYATNVGYMKDFDFTNNKKLNKYNTIAAFNRKNDSVPYFQIIDLKCQKWEDLKNEYNSFTQSIRMVDCNQNNTWSQQDKIWSMVVIGMDKDGNALFVFSRSPYTVHDFINILLKAPLNIYNLMYLEGGPEASFYLNHKGFNIEKMGSFETYFFENDINNEFYEIPNIIGITKNKQNTKLKNK